ncbi:MAG: HU family DNA-binding protein [Methylococcaceae bacterium]|nr:HU family DNA-binding protein [Methylococcaceae bacterium]
MHKSELINAIAGHADLTKTDAGRALDALQKAIENTLIAGDSVTLVGFGTFGVKDRSERTGRNPQTGKEITIAAAKVPFFKPGKSLKDSING